MPATFTVTGAVWQFMPDGTLDDPYLGVLASVTGRFVANVSASTALSVDDGAGVMYLTPVEFTVLSDGQISADGENPGVDLVAEDASFGLGRPLRWSLVVDEFEIDDEVIEPPVVWVDAFDADDEVSLSEWEADAEVWPIRVARGPRGLRGATGAGLIIGAGDPEGSVAASVGSIYSRTDGSSGIAAYLKESGSGSSGWSALVTAATLDAALEPFESAIEALQAAVEALEES